MVAPNDPPERRWFVRVENHVDGPHAESRIKAWLADGTLPSDILLSADARTWRRVKLPKIGPPKIGPPKIGPPKQKPAPR